MKNYNKILEAVNRGIQLALDDFDDEEPIKNIKSKQVQNRDYTKEYLDLMEEVVDLGLPSKTLWCKYNLDVNSNQLSKAEDWYGGYYAWGELEGNKPNKDGEIYFDCDNYKFGKNYYNNLTKYCNNPSFGLDGFTDNLTQLLPEDDAAYQIKKLHNYKFNIPTKEQLEELINYTNNYWVDNYDPNKIKHNPENDGGIKRLNGRIFEGNNKNQLFIPAAGYYVDSDIINSGSHCCLWTSSLDLNHINRAYNLSFDIDDISIRPSSRCWGFTVHPVINL